jgi:hypothetical protein
MKPTPVPPLRKVPCDPGKTSRRGAEEIGSGRFSATPGESANPFGGALHVGKSEAPTRKQGNQMPIVPRFSQADFEK